MAVQALGYAGFDGRARRLAAVRNRTGRPAGGRAQPVAAGIPVDDRKQRMSSTARCRTACFFGWEVADAAALDALASRLKRPRLTLPPRGRRSLTTGVFAPDCVFRDPAGNRLEVFFTGAEIDDTPFSPAVRFPVSATGPLGLGHAVLTVETSTR